MQQADVAAYLMHGADGIGSHSRKKQWLSECNKPMVLTNQPAAFIAYLNMEFV
jgi:hypothetical protein